MRPTAIRPTVFRSVLATAAAGLLLTSCGSGGVAPEPKDEARQPDAQASPADPGGLPGISERFRKQIPDATRQVVAVYGDGADRTTATVVLYTKDGDGWKKRADWPAHNGKKGWTPDHHEDDKRSPVGVFTLTDAGGVLADPGPGGLPYTRSDAFAAPRTWAKSHWHDFDLVIAIDYNRVKGTPPNDPTRPEGQSKGGSIWLHMDHGSGTSGCVSLSEQGMRHLLRTLEPDQHPVVVMGDKASLRA